MLGRPGGETERFPGRPCRIRLLAPRSPARFTRSVSGQDPARPPSLSRIGTEDPDETEDREMRDTERMQRPDGIDSQDWVNTTLRGEYRGFAIAVTKRAKVRGLRSDELITWWAIKDGKVATANDTRTHLLRVLDLTLDLTDEQRAIRDRVIASLGFAN